MAWLLLLEFVAPLTDACVLPKGYIWQLAVVQC